MQNAMPAEWRTLFVSMPIGSDSLYKESEPIALGTYVVNT